MFFKGGKGYIWLKLNFQFTVVFPRQSGSGSLTLSENFKDCYHYYYYYHKRGNRTVFLTKHKKKSHVAFFAGVDCWLENY